MEKNLKNKIEASDTSISSLLISIWRKKSANVYTIRAPSQMGFLNYNQKDSKNELSE